MITQAGSCARKSCLNKNQVIATSAEPEFDVFFILQLSWSLFLNKGMKWSAALTQWLSPLCLSLDSPTISSHTAAVLSKEQEARTWPNSGWAQVTLHTDPLCVFQLAVQCHSPVSLLSQTCAKQERGIIVIIVIIIIEVAVKKRQGKAGNCRWR